MTSRMVWSAVWICTAVFWTAVVLGISALVGCAPSLDCTAAGYESVVAGAPDRAAAGDAVVHHWVDCL